MQTAIHLSTTVGRSSFGLGAAMAGQAVSELDGKALLQTRGW